VPKLSVKPSSENPAGTRELQRRAEALARHRADVRVKTLAGAGELARLRSQLRVAAKLSARLATTHDIDGMARLIVEELHGTFAFYLAAIQRLDGERTLRLVAGAGPLAEVMTEFLLVEQPVGVGVNGRVARTGVSALVPDTRADPHYVVRDPATDPRSELSVAILVEGSVWGVLNIEAVEPNALTETDAVLVETIAASLGAAIHRAGLIGDLERTLTTTLMVLTSTVEAKDDYTAAHGQDVAGLAERVAVRMGLAPAEARDVRFAALLHDVGKIVVPSEILLKPAPLTDAEWDVMRGHAVAGGELVARIDAFAHLAPIVRACHERLDGGGYPDGLSGETIPLGARIIAACDSFDAITTDRPYRRARSRSHALRELRRVAGTQLDQRVVAALLEELAATDVQSRAGESQTLVHGRTGSVCRS
jgi:HD-GYP domain-containing protein (c-di-GMP phosphodiesterase class II)